ncbi:MAG TPA: peptide chain release factor aRF-1, partial [Candidatus Lokiarchaeia archaeon]|nr:peptide chain release factor aRF-1 [Candidatus Lokiarchaeia archaeon]
MSENRGQKQTDAYRDSFHIYKLRKEIEYLKEKKGFHTELITLFIPPDRDLSQVTAYLKNEVAESQNIKSKLTRKNVLDSISALINHLKMVKSVGPTGLVLMAGAIPQGNSPGTERIEKYVLEPPEPIRNFKYNCGSEFLLEPIEEMLVDKNVYGLIVVGHKEAAVAWVRGTHLNIVRSMTSGVHGKFRAGGQSARRFERLLEEGIHRFYERVAETANGTFLDMPDLKGIFIGGPGLSKQDFRDEHMLDYRLEEKIIDLVDTDSSAEDGIRSLLFRIQDRLENVRYVEEKQLIQKFLGKIAKDDELVTYGEADVRDALLKGAIETLFISEAIDTVRVKVKCESCGYTEEHTT